MSWLPTLQGFLFGLATIFGLNCLMMSDDLSPQIFFQKLLSSIFAAIAVAYAVSVH